MKKVIEHHTNRKGKEDGYDEDSLESGKKGSAYFIFSHSSEKWEPGDEHSGFGDEFQDFFYH